MISFNVNKFSECLDEAVKSLQELKTKVVDKHSQGEEFKHYIENYTSFAVNFIFNALESASFGSDPAYPAESFAR